MKKSILTIIWTLSSILLWCQNAVNIDSLLKITYSQLSDNLETAKRYEAIASYYWRVNPDSSLIFVDKLLNLSYKLKDSKTEANAYYIKAKVYTITAKYSEAHQFALKSLELFTKINDRDGQCKSITQNGNVFKRETKYNEAEIEYQKALIIAKAIKDTQSIAGLYNNLGIIQDYSGNYNKAIEYYFEALKIFEQLKDENGQAKALSNIGIVQYYNKNPQLAIDFIKRANELNFKLDNYSTYSEGQTNLGDIYLSIDSLDIALNCYRIGLKYNIGDPLQESKIYGGLASIFGKQKNYSQAENYYLKQLDLIEKLDASSEIASAMLQYAQLLIETKNYPKAIEILENCKLKSLGNNELTSVIFKNLSICNAHINNYQKAYNYLKEYNNIADTIFTLEKNKQIHDIETKYETEKKDMLIAQHQKDDIAKRKIIGLLMALLVLSIGAVVLYRKRNEEKVKVNALLSAQNQVLQSNNLELSAELENIRLKKATKPLEELFVTLTGNGKEVVKLTDITHIVADGNSVEIFTKDKKKYYDWQKIKHYKELLEPSGLFLQVHRSYIINYQYITAKKANEITLNHSNSIPIGNTLKESVHDWLKEKLG